MEKHNNVKFFLRDIWNGMAVFGIICFCCCLLAAVYLFRNGPRLYTLASKVATRAGVGTTMVEKVIQQSSSRPKGIKLST